MESEVTILTAFAVVLHCAVRPDGIVNGRLSTRGSSEVGDMGVIALLPDRCM